MEQLLEPVTEAFTEGPEVELPEFNLLDQFGPYRPLSWFVGAPLDEVELVQVYDELVELRPLKGGRKSLRALNLLDRVGFGDFFEGPRAPGEWYEPIALVAGLAAVTSGEEVVVSGDDVSVFTRMALLHVCGECAYSNALGTYVTPIVAASDAHMPTLRVPALRTHHPLARALVSSRAGLPALWMLNLLMRQSTVRVGLQACFKQIQGEARIWYPRGPRRKYVRTLPTLDRAVFRDTVLEALAFAEGNSRGCAQEIERLLYRRVMWGSEIERMLGRAAGSEAPLTKKTRLRTIDRLNEILEQQCSHELDP